MKSLVDYLKENVAFTGYIGKHFITIDMFVDEFFECLTIKIDEEKRVSISFNYAENTIQDLLYDLDKTEIRFCEECGKPYDAGFMAGDGGWYCCEDCFEDVMNRDYGKGKWRGTDEEGYYGGFYESLQDDGEWEDTGIFWTEWN